MYNASFLNLLSHLVLKAKRILNVQGQKENSDLVLKSDSKLLKQFFQMFIAKFGTVFLTVFTVLKLLVSLTERQVLLLFVNQPSCQHTEYASFWID